MKSPPAPVRTGRPTKPKQQAPGVPRTPAVGAIGAAAAAAGGHGQQHLLPPPAIQREARSSFLKSGKNRGSGRSTTAVRMVRRPSALCQHSPAQQRQEERKELFVFGGGSSSDGGGGGAGSPSPRTSGTGQQAPSTPGVADRPPLSSSSEASDGVAGHLSDTQGIAPPATPTVARDPETPGFASTPGICSPPAPCHRGTGFGGSGGTRRAYSRLSAGVDVDVDIHFAEGHRPPKAGDDGCGGCEFCAAGGGGEFGRGIGTISSSECCDEAGSGSSGAVGGEGVGRGRGFHACRRTAGGSGAEGSPERTSRNGAHGTETESAGCRRDRPTRNEQLLDASSSERFSEDLDEAGEAWGGAGRWMSRRSGRRLRRPAEEREGVSPDPLGIKCVAVSWQFLLFPAPNPPKNSADSVPTGRGV